MGIAHNLNGGLLTAYTVSLARPEEVTAWGKQRLTRRDDPRIHRMRAHLQSLEQPDLVVFEDVEFQTYTKQCQLWASFRTVVWLAFSGRSTLDCVPVSSLKKFATRYGAADKELMKKALKLQHSEIACDTLGDDAIDAIWIFLWAQKNLSRIPAKTTSK